MRVVKALVGLVLGALAAPIIGVLFMVIGPFLAALECADKDVWPWRIGLD